MTKGDLHATSKAVFFSYVAPQCGGIAAPATSRGNLSERVKLNPPAQRTYPGALSLL